MTVSRAYRALKIALCAALIAPTVARADLPDITGSLFYQTACSPVTAAALQAFPNLETATAIGTCIGFITGANANYPGKLCFPVGVTIREKAQVWTAYLNNHPDSLHLPAPFTLAVAMAQAYPCPK